MARDGNGTYTAPVNTWNPAINGVLASAGDWQQLLNDIVAALTQSVSRDGQTPMTGNLALGNNKITGLTPGSGTGEALAFQQLFNQGTMADIASAATTDIGVQNTNFLRVTGNTTITSFGTNYRGPRFLVFEQNITLTNSSTLVLPGGANISANAGDAAIVIPGATLGTPDKWIVIAYQSATNPSQIVTLNGTQTLTNKTLTNPVINGFTGSTAAINIGSGQLVKDTAGNLGLGVTPSAWESAWKSFDIGAVGSITSGYGEVDVGNNFYRLNTGAYRYKTTAVATNYIQSGGQHLWYTAPSGTAGNAISFTQAMTLDASGNLGVGATGPSAKIHAYTPSASNVLGRFENTVASVFYGVDSAGTGYFGNNGPYPILFQTNNTERARIDSSGNLLIQTTNNGASTAGGIRMGDIAAINQDINSLYINAGAVGASTATRLKTGSSAVQIFMDSAQGSIKFGRAASGTAGTTFDFTESARIDSSGNLIQSAPTTPPSLATNGQMVFNLTSNTNLRVSVRGSDGVTRTANITLA
jgi:hypothetical protein